MAQKGDVKIKVQIFGVASLDGYVIRFIAPISADAILDKMPFVLRGRFSFGKKEYWTLPGLDLREGTNPKSTREVEAGDLVYNPKTDELMIIMKHILLPNKINMIGKITSDLKPLENARNGLNTKIFKVKI